MTYVAPVSVSSTQFAGANQLGGRSKADNAATGVGVAGATTAYASNRAAKSGIFAKVGAAGSKATQMTQETINKLKLASEGASKFKKLGLWFKIKKTEFVGDFAKLAAKVKGNKVLNAIMNNKLAKKFVNFFGGVMAFFVIVPSILSMVNMVDDLSRK